MALNTSRCEHWAWADAPEWVRALAPLNGELMDDATNVSYYPAGEDVHIEMLPKMRWSTIVHVWSPKGILVFRFHS